MITLRALREENNKTLAEVASVLGVTGSAVSQYESGVRRVSLESVLILSQHYCCTAEEIIEAQLNSCQSAR